jgi:hypothetical protein
MTPTRHHIDGLEFREFTLGDRPRLDPALRAARYPLCEYAFATLYCWQGCNQTRWAFLDDWLLLRYEHEGSPKLLCPVGTGDLRAMVDACFDWLAAAGAPVEVTMVPEPARQRLRCEKCWFEPDKRNFDYIYLREDLATYPGSRFSRKRNHVARFLKRYEWSVTPIEPGDAREAMDFLDAWAGANGVTGNRLLDYEVEANKACLANLRPLGVHGQALRVDGRIVGMSIGEELTSEVFAVHYEKADREIEGAYQMLTQQFTRTVPERYVWLDREQDMGVPGLRKAKEQFFPVAQEPAFTVSPEKPSPA